MGLLSLFGLGEKSNLSKTETTLLNNLNFNTTLFAELKNLTKTEIKQLPAIEQETGDVLNNEFFNGVYLETTEEEANNLVKKLKPKFKSNGYLVFVYEGEDHKKNIAAIKGTDELDILRYRRTDGINHDLENEDIVNKISEWKSKYGLIVLGCNRDWLEVEFDKLPTDMDAFANEVYNFCPDAVEQGVGTIDNLKQMIITTKGVWLWWD